jgi:hypothetical protein
VPCRQIGQRGSSSNFRSVVLQLGAWPDSEGCSAGKASETLGFQTLEHELSALAVICDEVVKLMEAHAREVKPRWQDCSTISPRTRAMGPTFERDLKIRLQCLTKHHDLS